MEVSQRPTRFDWVGGQTTSDLNFRTNHKVRTKRQTCNLTHARLEVRPESGEKSDSREGLTSSLQKVKAQVGPLVRSKHDTLFRHEPNQDDLHPPTRGHTHRAAPTHTHHTHHTPHAPHIHTHTEPHTHYTHTHTHPHTAHTPHPHTHFERMVKKGLKARFSKR
jgi:hypothetical protein